MRADESLIKRNYSFRSPLGEPLISDFSIMMWVPRAKFRQRILKREFTFDSKLCVWWNENIHKRTGKSQHVLNPHLVICHWVAGAIAPVSQSYELQSTVRMRRMTCTLSQGTLTTSRKHFNKANWFCSYFKLVYEFLWHALVLQDELFPIENGTNVN